MIKLKDIKGYEDVRDDLTPYGHTSLMETCRYLKELYVTEIRLEYNRKKTGIKVMVFDGAECIDEAHCLFKDLNTIPRIDELLDGDMLVKIEKFVNDLDFDDPMDGDGTAQLADFFLFVLDERNGNLDKEELELGYAKWSIK